MQIGGLDAFKTHRNLIVARGGGRAASVLARACLVTQRALEDIDQVDLMTCSWSNNPFKDKVKFPACGVIFPDLGPWNLGPYSKSSSELYVIMERECSELMRKSRIDNDVIFKESWNLFVRNGWVCSKEDGEDNFDRSRPLLVREKEMSASTLRNGAIRLYAVATFLLTLVKHLDDACFVCNTKGDKLQKCHSTIYCGRDCQVEDFKNRTHRSDCKVVKTLYERYSKDDPFPEHDYIGGKVS